MRKKVLVEHLSTGMYVAGLDRPWLMVEFRPPFETHGFCITNEEELAAVRGYCRHVFIDPRLGVDTSQFVEEVPNWVDAAAGKVPIHMRRADLAEPVYPDRTTLEEEFVTARSLEKHTREFCTRVIKDIQAGKTIRAEEVFDIIGPMVQSIVRNPDALTWLSRVKKKDEYTYTHSISTCVLALTFGRHLGLSPQEMETLGAAALLQDIGKARLPEDLLNKVKTPNDKEFSLIRKHVELTVDILRRDQSVAEEILQIIYNHHERFDGSGYPRGLKGDRIGLWGTITGLVDTFDAMRNDRPWRPAMTSFDALMMLYGRQDRDFPRAVIEQFIQCIGIFPVGAFVELNSGHVGVVISRNRVQQLKPRIMLIRDAAGEELKELMAVDLASVVERAEGPWKIERVIEASELGIDAREYFTPDDVFTTTINAHDSTKAEA